MTSQHSITLRRSHWEQMRNQVIREIPLEACGLVAGQKKRSSSIFEIDNVLRSPVRYRMVAKKQLDAFLAMEKAGWELLAIYHSHPSGPSGPSASDLSEANYPEAVHLIWSPRGSEWQCRAFWLKNDGAIELEIVVSDEE